MQVVILCGGQGTRLREETEFRPKPLVELGGRPILWHLMKGYAEFGYRDFVLCLGYRGNMLKQYFLDYEAMNNDFSVELGARDSIEYLGGHGEQGFRVTLADTGLDTMTGGRLLRARRHVRGDTFMMTYGDAVSDVDIDALEKFHRSHGKIATVTTVRPRSRFGALEIDGGGTVTSFAEKPVVDGAINAGFFVFNAEIFDYLTGDDCTLEADPLEALAREGQLMAYRHSGFWHSMDTYRDFLALNELWRTGEAPWRVWENRRTARTGTTGAPQ